MRASIIFFPWAAKKVLKQKDASIYEGKFQRGKSRNKVKCRTEGDLLLWGEFTMRFKDRKHPLNGYLNALDKQYEISEFLMQQVIPGTMPRILQIILWT